MLGRMAPKWAAAQQSYFKWLGRRNTGKHWLVTPMVKLLNISWDMWDHQNRILHGKLHRWIIAEEEQIDQQIEDEYECGYVNLPKKYYRWLVRPLKTM